MKKPHLIGALCAVALSFITVSANAASFIPIGDVPDHLESNAYGVSADGTVVVGRADTLEPGSIEIEVVPFRWTQGDGMVGLDKLSDTSEFAWAVQASADGSVITGIDSHAGGHEAFRWTASTGTQGLGTLPGEDWPRSEATDISADGSVIVGRLTGTFGSFIWTTADGMMQIGGEINVNAISGNGSYLVGEKFGVGSGAYLWTQDGGVITSDVFLGPGAAEDVSSDGSVVVGRAPIGVNDLMEGFRWTQDDGMISLGTFGGEPGSIALGVSADGSVVVGFGVNTDDEEVAFIWDETNGIQSLQDVLTGLDVNLDGWDLQYAFDVSADGSVIVGYGDNPDGVREAWIANLTTTPNASLVGRLPATPGGDDYQAYYDPNLDITWATDANINGLDTWDNQMAWVAGLTIGGVSGWRLPSADVNGDGTVVDCFGGGVSDCADNEMGFLYWEEGITAATGSPFSNVMSSYYWSGTAYLGPRTRVWDFAFGDGSQNILAKNNVDLAWAVHDGDVGADDSDSDGIVDLEDNCIEVPNGPLIPDAGSNSQLDTDGDGYGNMCDGDLNNDGSTNTLDLNLYKLAHRTSPGDTNYNVNADFNGDVVINTLDLNIYKGLHRKPPGPSCCAP